jgi:hypothetical protein
MFELAKVITIDLALLQAESIACTAYIPLVTIFSKVTINLKRWPLRGVVFHTHKLFSSEAVYIIRPF